MARVSTVGSIDSFFHVYNRGVDKREIFSDKKDYLRFYESLFYFNTVEPVTNLTFARIQDYKAKEALVDVHAYCLLPNHFHLLLRQKTHNGIGEFMKRLSGGYTTYFNERHDRSGSLFQGIYKRALIDSDSDYRYVFAYINENHTVHTLQVPGDDMCYSSSRHYQYKMKSKVISNQLISTYNVIEAQSLAKDIHQKRKGVVQTLE